MNIGSKLSTDSNDYKVIQFRIVNLPDSFVLNKQNEGNGEGRLYIGSNSDLALDSFFNKKVKIWSGFFLKSNLTAVLEKEDPIFASANKKYFVNCEKVRLMPNDIRRELRQYSDNQEIPFYFISRSSDPSRYYIGPRTDQDKESQRRFNLLRMIGISNVTKVCINMVQSLDGKIQYYFELSCSDPDNFFEFKEIESVQVNMNEQFVSVPDDAIPSVSNLKTTQMLSINDKEFSSAVKKKENFCLLTHIGYDKLLRVVRIKPLDVCSQEEAMDIDNGLLLSLNMAVLFENGLFTFNDEGILVRSSALDAVTSMRFGLYGYEGQKFFDMGKKSEAFRSYMKYHRENVFNTREED